MNLMDDMRGTRHRARHRPKAFRKAASPARPPHTGRKPGSCGVAAGQAHPRKEATNSKATHCKRRNSNIHNDFCQAHLQKQTLHTLCPHRLSPPRGLPTKCMQAAPLLAPTCRERSYACSSFCGLSVRRRPAPTAVTLQGRMQQSRKPATVGRFGTGRGPHTRRHTTRGGRKALQEFAMLAGVQSGAQLSCVCVSLADGWHLEICVWRYASCPLAVNRWRKGGEYNLERKFQHSKGWRKCARSGAPDAPICPCPANPMLPSPKLNANGNFRW